MKTMFRAVPASGNDIDGSGKAAGSRAQEEAVIR
jgi:hypothetical protein